MEDSAFKPCPFCKEQIRQEAIKCRFCGEWLEPREPGATGKVSAVESDLPPPLVGADKSIAAPPPPPMPSTTIRYGGFQRIKKFLSGVGIFLFAILWLVGIALLFVGGAWVGAYVEPSIAFAAVTLIEIGLPICLLLLIFRKSRGWGGTGILLLSLPLSLWLWIASLVYAMSVSIAWTVIGILMGGLGVIPVALIMTLLRRDWPNFGGLAVTGILVLVLRFFGAWIVDRAEQREFELGAVTVAGKQRAISRTYGGLSALFGVLALTMWWLAFYFAIMGFQAVDPEVPAPVDPALFIILSFLMAAACGLVAVVCGYLAYRFIKKARMPE